MPILTTQRKKQRSLIIVLALVVVASFGVLYFGFLSQKTQEPPFVGGEDVGILRGIKEVKINLNLLGEDRFRSLVPYEKILGDVDTGRDNPFIPYNTKSNTESTTSTNL